MTVVSLGPGDPDQLTLGAWRALRRADVVFVPSTRDAAGGWSSRAGDVLAASGIDEGRIRRFELPMSRDRGAALAAYRGVAEEVAALRATHRVAVAAEGDAGIYASVHYVGDALEEAGVPVAYLAGVPSFVAAGASAGLHVVRGSERLVVMPSVTDAGVLLASLDAGDTVVAMKLPQSETAIREALRLRPDAGWHYFEHVGTEEELHLTSPDEIAARHFPYFSLLIVRPQR